jgi:transcriptional regulator with XRE-family HTH domain
MSLEALGDFTMMTGAQLRAARALLGIDQKTLAEMAGVSVPTVQRMEASGGTVRGVIESLTRIVEALDRAGVELIAVGAVSSAGGRGVRLKATAAAPPSSAIDGSADGPL